MTNKPFKKIAINKQLLNNILNFDFLFLETKPKTFYYSSNITKVKYNIRSSQLNLLDTLHSLKHFLRMLQFFKKHKKVSKIYYWSYENSLSCVFDNMLKDVATFHMLTTFFNGFIKFNKQLNCFLILNTQIKKNEFLNFLKRNKFTLIQKIDLYNEIYDSYYKIYNDLADIKKIIFIGAFISNIFK